MAEKPATRFEPLSRLWRILAWPEVLMGLLGLLAGSFLLAAVIPQVPPQVGGNPQAWLAAQGGALGLSRGLIQRLGLFDILHSGWFRLALALSGLALTVRLVESAEMAWRAAAPHRWSAPQFALWGPRALHRTLSLSLPAEEAPARLREALRRQGFRWADVEDAPVPSAVAGRRPWSLWAWPVAYGALLIALAGLMVLDGRGWQSGDWQPAPGDIHTIGHRSPLSVRLDAFDPPSGEGGACASTATLSWLDKGLAVAQSRVRLGRPASYGGVAVRLVDVAPAIRVRGWDDEGRPLTLQSGGPESQPADEIDLVFASPQEQRFVLIPERNLYLALVPTPQAAAGQVALVLSRLDDEGNVILLGVLDRSGEMPVGDLRLQIEIGVRPVLRFAHRPAVWPLLGLLLAVIALGVAWLRQPALVWLALEAQTDAPLTLHLLARPHVRGDRWWAALGERLEEALADGD